MTDLHFTIKEDKIFWVKDMPDKPDFLKKSEIESFLKEVK